MSPVAGAETPPFPFIIPRGHSGTTLLRATFDAHPNLSVPGKSHFVVQFLRRRARFEAHGAFDVQRFRRELLDHWAFKRWGLPESVVRDGLDEAAPAWPYHGQPSHGDPVGGQP